MRTLTVVDAGTVGYGPALDWQNELYRRRVAGEIPDTVLLLEHPHVYTLGRRFSAEHLLLGEEALARRGIEVYECDRGGSITYHGPGQLVGYPVLALEDPDVIAYLRCLEEVLIRSVNEFGVAAGRREGLTGVWVGEDKLASIGVNVSRGVTKHGFALNVTTDLSFFAGMVPCGIPAVTVTSLERLLPAAPPMDAVRSTVVGHLAAILGAEVRSATAAELGLLGVTMREEASILRFPNKPGSHRTGSPRTMEG
ncbi:MAG TPA: lipoyl(octanoyl) transferase LipB [Actinomycetota bacterium]|nr:lipoyl(octanoyl) transferase LipB [Actinomycetota bacterium]